MAKTRKKQTKTKITLSEVERELIKVNLSRIKEENSFSIKTFFTIVAIIAGWLTLSFDKQGSELSNTIAIFVVIGILVFITQTSFTISNIRRMHNTLIENIRSSQGLKKYDIKKKEWFDKILFGLSLGLMSLIILVMIVKETNTIIYIIAIIMAIIGTFSNRHY